MLMLLLPLASCADRLADEPEPERMPVCMLYPARGYEQENQRGDPTLLLDADGSTGRTCGCMTPEEFEDELRVDEFHERALLECQELAATFASDDCQEMYEAGEWLSLMRPATGDFAWLTNGKDLDCSEQGADEGCSIAGTRALPILPELMVLGLGLRRRTRSRTSAV